MQTVTRDIPTTFYIADDGTEFTSESECKVYSKRLTMTKVYIPMSRGEMNKNIEVYSTLELAEASLKFVIDRDNWGIQEAYIDEIER